MAPDADRLTFARARKDLYSFLARAFCYPPGQDWLDRLGAPEIRESLAVIQGAEGPGAPALSEVRRAFFQLLKVPGDLYVRPYESVYSDSVRVAGEETGGLLMGEAAVAVQRVYEAAGYSPPDHLELPDYLGHELAFAGYLWSLEEDALSAANIEAADARRAETLAFVGAHLSRYVRRLVEVVGEKDPTGVYASLGAIATTLVEEDAAP